jgi:hypothetical protein
MAARAGVKPAPTATARVSPNPGQRVLGVVLID